MKRGQTTGETGLLANNEWTGDVDISKPWLFFEIEELTVFFFSSMVRVMKVAKKIQDEGKKIFFAVSNSKDFSYELGEFGMGDVSGDKPVVAARDERDRKYVMSDEFS